MKVTELRILKEETVYKRVLDELKIKGLNKLYIRKEEHIDYLDIILSVIDFLQTNKKVLKKLSEEQYENIVVIIIDEILESMNINVSEENIEKVISLLKNSLLIQKLSTYIWNKIKKIPKIFTICCKSNKNVVENVVKIKYEEYEENEKEFNKQMNKPEDNKKHTVHFA